MADKLIVANWKMNPATLREALKLTHELAEVAEVENVNVVVCPPFPYLASVSGHWTFAKIGAQDMFWEAKGAYTGEVSPVMLKSLGVSHVILGHSERRRFLGETDEIVNKKVITALRAGLKVILCVGEDKDVRNQGMEAVQELIKQQLSDDLEGTMDLATNQSLIIAYEPVWSLSTSGTGEVDTPGDARRIIEFIKEYLKGSLKPRVIYGGSVNAKNVEFFIDNPSVDGALVGAASLKAEEFKKIIRIASQV